MDTGTKQQREPALVATMARINSTRKFTAQDTAGKDIPMVQFELRSLDKSVRVKPLTMRMEDAGHLKIGSTLAFTVHEATPEEVKAFYER